MDMDIVAIIVAGGSGKRFASHIPKQFLNLNSKTILELSISLFHHIPNIIVVSHKNFLEKTTKILEKSKLKSQWKVVEGGDTRQLSVYNALIYIKENFKNTEQLKVLIHDAVRPLATPKLLEEIIKTLDKHPAVIPVVPITDTLVMLENGEVKEYVEREKFFRVQTPQGFLFPIIMEAHEKAVKDGFFLSPDDSFLVKKYSNTPITTIQGDPKNIKITYPEDLEIAKTLLRISK